MIKCNTEDISLNGFVMPVIKGGVHMQYKNNCDVDTTISSVCEFKNKENCIFSDPHQYRVLEGKGRRSRGLERKTDWHLNLDWKLIIVSFTVTANDCHPSFDFEGLYVT